MSARKLLYAGMLCSPVLFLGAIGIGTRTNHTRFRPVEMGPSECAQLYAYVPYMNLADRAGCDESAEEAAQAWVEATRAGKLVPLAPACADDNSGDGPRTQVLNGLMTLESKLRTHAMELAAQGKRDAAAEDYALDYELSQTMKYSDFMIASLAAFEERRVLSHLVKLGALSPAVRTDVANRINAVLRVEPPYGRMLALDTLQSLEYKLRKCGVPRDDSDSNGAVNDVRQLAGEQGIKAQAMADDDGGAASPNGIDDLAMSKHSIRACREAQDLARSYVSRLGKSG